jgi:hypothetical protein
MGSHELRQAPRPRTYAHGHRRRNQRQPQGRTASHASRWQRRGARVEPQSGGKRSLQPAAAAAESHQSVATPAESGGGAHAMSRMAVAIAACNQQQPQNHIVGHAGRERRRGPCFEPQGGGTSGLQPAVGGDRRRKPPSLRRPPRPRPRPAAASSAAKRRRVSTRGEGGRRKPSSLREPPRPRPRSGSSRRRAARGSASA